MKAVLEVIEAQSSVLAFENHQPAFDIPWHFHPEFELTHILSGTGIRYVGNDISNFGNDDLVLLGANLPHCWISDRQSTEEARAVVIQWRSEVINDIPELRPVHELFLKAHRGLQFPSSQFEEVKRLMAVLVTQEPLQRYVTLLEILDLLARDNLGQPLADASYQSDLSFHTNNRLDLVQQYVQKHFQHKIKLADVAAELGMTEQAFSRFFSKTMKRPFFVYLNEFRINTAAALLVESDQPVTEISYYCGYESPSFFHQQFRKFKGHSPLGFRKVFKRF